MLTVKFLKDCECWQGVVYKKDTVVEFYNAKLRNNKVSIIGGHGYPHDIFLIGEDIELLENAKKRHKNEKSR